MRVSESLDDLDRMHASSSMRFLNRLVLANRLSHAPNGGGLRVFTQRSARALLSSFDAVSSQSSGGDGHNENRRSFARHSKIAAFALTTGLIGKISQKLILSVLKIVLNK